VPAPLLAVIYYYILYFYRHFSG